LTDPRAVPLDAPPAGLTGDRPGPLSSLTRAWLIALIGWTALLSFYGLDGGARFEPIDCWVAQTAREMLDADNWLVPRFSGETRMQKSPGPYWAVMLVSLVRGTPVDEVSARVPNAFAAVGLVLLVFWLARHIAGERAALFAGFSASSSVLILWWSHRGASDLGLTFWTTLSLTSLWIAIDSAPAGLRRTVLLLLGYFAAGMGMLYKMPMPLVVVGLPACVYVLLRCGDDAYDRELTAARDWDARARIYLRERLAIFRSPWHLLGLALFLLPWLPWAIAVSLVEDAALLKWKVEFLDRFTGALPNVENQGKFKYIFTYLGPPVLYCLPFSLSLPAAFARAFRREPGVKRNGNLFLLVWFCSLLVFFTASTGKEWRYFLPALPPLFVLLGIELAAFFDPQRPFSRSMRWLTLGLVCVGLPAGLFGGTYAGLRAWWHLRGRSELTGLYNFGDVLLACGIMLVILCAGFGAAAVLYTRRRTYASFGTLVVTMWATWLWTWPHVMPLFMSQRPFVDFAQQLADPQPMPPGFRTQLRSVGSQDSRITWYSDGRFPRVIDQLALLREQEGKRTLDFEIRRYGEVMLEELARPEPVLYVSCVPDYVKFRVVAARELAAQGRSMPPGHLWLQARYGREDTQYVLFGNKSPRFPEPELRLSEKVLEKLAAKGLQWPPVSTPPATAPAAAPASAPADVAP